MGKGMKILSFLLAVVMAGVMVAGCVKTAPPDAGGSPAPSTTPEPTPQVKQKDVSLRFSWWGSDRRHGAFLTAIEMFEKQNPNVKIIGEYGGWDGHYEKLVTQLMGKTAPDIIQIDVSWLNQLVSTIDPFVDLNSRKDLIDTSGIDAKFLADNCSVDGKLIGLPSGVTTDTVLMNVPLCEKIGLNKDSHLTWDDLIVYGKKLQEMDPENYLLSTDVTYTQRMLKVFIKQNTGKDFISEDFKVLFTEDTLVKTFSYWKSLVDNKVVQPFEESIVFSKKSFENPKWTNGKFALNMIPASTVALFRGVDFDLDVMLPFYSETSVAGSGVWIVPAMMECVNKESKHIDEALKFVNFFINDEDVIVAMGHERSVVAQSSGNELLLKNNLGDACMTRAIEINMPGAIPIENGPSLDPQLTAIIEDMVEKVAFAKLTPEQAAKEMMTRTTQLASELLEQSKK